MEDLCSPGIVVSKDQFQEQDDSQSGPNISLILDNSKIKWYLGIFHKYMNREIEIKVYKILLNFTNLNSYNLKWKI